MGVDDIVKANNIPNAAAIEVNQLIFIPGRVQVESVDVIVAAAVDQNKDEFIWPVNGKIVSYFKDKIGAGVNQGIDIQPAGDVMVKAVREGKVVFADYLGGYGQTVMLDHGDGFVTVYAKNAKLLVKMGDHVSKGSALAAVGKKGSVAMTHFEIRRGAVPTNPLYYLP